MTTQPRLHVVTCPPAADDVFHAVFLVLEQAALCVVEADHVTPPIAWGLSQYIDLADAGYGDKNSELYRRSMFRLKSFVGSLVGTSAERSLLGRSAVLSQLLDELLTAPSHSLSEGIVDEWAEAA
jgi:hypothetical protein